MRHVSRTVFGRVGFSTRAVENGQEVPFLEATRRVGQLAGVHINSMHSAWLLCVSEQLNSSCSVS